ncbi:unnamed protein product [Brassica oleracea var. botrytis]|uniref:E2 ubiquitin-conjugating enzyme n=1 Tax=Brassica napus TaxID=3708 RepID=A0A816M889_BRANA|nr:unnamed protein product [Brassica napus]
MDFDEYEYLEKTVENPHLENNEVENGGGDEKPKSEVKERSRSSRHRSDDKRDEDEDGRRSKRSRSHHRSRSRDRERDRHRSSRDHRDRERGGRDREKDRDKEERNGKEREGGKDKDRDSNHEKDRERDRSRRSRSRSERRRSREREKSQEIETKERDTKDRDRDRRRHKDKKEDKVEPEADPERDQRTVFAYQIALRATERDVYEFFSRAGKVRDVRIIMDRISRRSRGIGYVEFYETMSVPMAIALSGQPLLGQPVMVKPSEAEKNLVQSTTAAAGAGGMLGPYSGGARRLYVGNLHVNMSEDDLRKVFESFGSVELVQVPRDETGHCKGFGFVQFARLEDARNAVNLNGQLEIAGRAIKVSAVTDQTEVPDAGQAQNTGDLDDDDGAGLSLNAQSRAALMMKLDRSGTSSSTGLTAVPSILGATSTVSPLVAPVVQGGFPAVAGLAGLSVHVPAVVDPVGVPSECLLLKNMFDPSTETELDFDKDIEEDVRDECSKFGELNHIFVDKNSMGFVYLRFENAQAAMGAQRALHGRWFAGKMITATYMVHDLFHFKTMEHEQDDPGTAPHGGVDSLLENSLASESMCDHPTVSNNSVHTDKAEDSGSNEHPNIYREDIVRSNKTGSIGVVSEVAGDSDSDMSDDDDDDDDEEDDEDNSNDDDDDDDDGEEEEGKKGNEDNSGNYKCGTLEGDQIRVLWMDDDTEPVQGVKDLTVVDRGFLHGDYVASASEPTGQVGVVVDANISVDLLAPDGSVHKDISTKKLKRIRDFAVGDYVVHGPWLGRVDDVLDNVTVLFDDGSMCKVLRAEPLQLKPITKNNLEEDANFPYHPGQRVKASSSSVLKTSRWLSGLWKPNRLEGTVTKVTAGSIFVYWIASAGVGPDSSVSPPEEQSPSDLTLLSSFTHANWQVGDWCLLPSVNQSATIPLHKHVSKLRLYDSQANQHQKDEVSEKNEYAGITAEALPKETSVSSLSKEPAHEPWPLHRKKIRKLVIKKDKKVKKKEESFERSLLIVNSRTRVDVAWQDGTVECGREATTLIPIETPGDHEFVAEQYVVEKASDDDDNKTEAKRVGVVKSVNAKERTASVRWLKPLGRAEEPREFDEEEIVSVYELEGHPDYDYCYGDVVVRLSPVTIALPASSSGNSLEEATEKDNGDQDTETHQEATVHDREENEVNTDLSELSWVGNITGLKDGDIEVTWADGVVSTVGPQAVYVVGRDDDDESTGAESDSSDAASWETVDDDDKGAPEIPEEDHGRSSFTEGNSDAETNAENDSGRNGALALPLAAIEFVTRLASGIFSRGRKTEDPSSSSPTGEKQAEFTNPSGERDSFLDDPTSPNLSATDNCESEGTVLENEALERSKSEKSDEPVTSEGDSCSFRRFDISQEPLDHHFLGADEQKTKERRWFKKVDRDWKILQNNLPDGIFVRVYEDRMDLLRAVIAGAYGTPYQDGLFFFDFHLPPDYPSVPPSAYYHSGGWRLNPNLYEEGKVCLSLLNTWTGRGNEVWDPKSSSILQVLVSLQGLVLNSKPYFNEAGYDRQIGTAEGEKNSLGYNENTFLLNCKTMMYLMRRPPKDFEELIKEHFKKRGYYILKACEAYMKGYLIGSLAKDASIINEHSSANSTSVGFKLMLAKIAPKLFSALSEVGADCNEFKHLQQQ